MGLGTCCRAWIAAAESADTRRPPPTAAILQDGSTALFSAANEGHDGVVGQLVAARATVDAPAKVSFDPSSVVGKGG